MLTSRYTTFVASWYDACFIESYCELSVFTASVSSSSVVPPSAVATKSYRPKAPLISLTDLTLELGCLVVFMILGA